MEIGRYANVLLDYWFSNALSVTRAENVSCCCSFERLFPSEKSLTLPMLPRST